MDDLFQVTLSTGRSVPLAVKYFFDLLDEQAQQHGIADQDTVHIWKTNSLPLRFWINIIKNPQLVFDVQTSDSVDAVLLVIAQTFVDACTLADHKLGRVSGPGGLGARVGRPGGARTRSGSLGEERREASDRPWGLGEA